MGYFCPLCKMEVIDLNNHIDCPGLNRDSGPFPGKVMGCRGICSKCGEVVNNVAYHESICGKIDKGFFEKEIDRTKKLEEAYCWMVFSEIRVALEQKQIESDNKIKELEAENKKLREALRIANEELSSCNRRLNRIMDDSYNDVMPDRDDYR